MKIKEVTNYLEERFPLCLQEDFDNCGVQCGDVEQEVTGALVCFEMSEKVIEEALAMNANLVISHHPLMLKRGICKIEPTNRVGSVICKALGHNMVLYSMHTNIDSAEGGGNDVFAEKLDLRNVRVLVPSEAEGMAEHNGLGRIGTLPEPMPVMDFLHYVKTKMSLQVLRYHGDTSKIVSAVALPLLRTLCAPELTRMCRVTSNTTTSSRPKTGCLSPISDTMKVSFLLKK